MGNYKRNYSDLKGCLEDILRNEGMACLENSSKLISILTDLIPQNRGDINMVKRMAEHGILRDFRQAHAQGEASRNRVIHSAVDRLVNWESIDIQKAEGYVHIFAQVMRWQLVAKVSVIQEHLPGTKNNVILSNVIRKDLSWKNNILMAVDSSDFNKQYQINRRIRSLNLPSKPEIFSVTFLDTKPNPVQNYVDVSENMDGSVVAWAVQRPQQDWRKLSSFDSTLRPTYDLFIAADGGINGKLACRMLFKDCINLMYINFDGKFHTDETVDMNYMFSGFNGSSLDLSSLNTAKAEDMSFMFYRCHVPRLDISAFNTKMVRYAHGMFLGCDAEIYFGKLDFHGSDFILYSHSNISPFMDDSKLVRGQHWTELFGAKRYEITAPKNGKFVCKLRCLDTGVEIKKGELLGQFETTFSRVSIYSPCDGVIVKRNVYDHTRETYRQKGDMMLVIYSHLSEKK